MPRGLLSSTPLGAMRVLSEDELMREEMRRAAERVDVMNREGVIRKPRGMFAHLDPSPHDSGIPALMTPAAKSQYYLEKHMGLGPENIARGGGLLGRGVGFLGLLGGRGFGLKSLHGKANRLMGGAEKMGHEVVDHNIAGTGTHYIRIRVSGGDEIVVRIGDHAEAYVPRRGERRILVSPDEGSVDEALEILKKPETVRPYGKLSDEQVGAFLQGDREAVASLAQRLTDTDTSGLRQNSAQRSAQAKIVAEKYGVDIGVALRAIRKKLGVRS